MMGKPGLLDGRQMAARGARAYRLTQVLFASSPRRLPYFDNLRKQDGGSGLRSSVQTCIFGMRRESTSIGGEQKTGIDPDLAAGREADFETSRSVSFPPARMSGRGNEKFT
jgi:hypothetical protein